MDTLEVQVPYEFTTDWFSWSPPIWSQIVRQMSSRGRFLEIGSFEGRSAVWLIENAVADGGELVCVDTWEGGEEHKPQGHDMGAVERRFHQNIRLAQDRVGSKKIGVRTIRDTSQNALSQLLAEKPDDQAKFDFVYIDGSHQAPDVITDAVMSWGLLKVGGIMIFDDYGWGGDIPETHKPTIAIDAFLNIYQDRINLVHKFYQVIVQKTAA